MPESTTTTLPFPSAILHLEPWRCHYCGTPIGDGIDADDYLRLGGVPCYVWKGRCPACLRRAEYHRADRRFQRSLDQYINS